MGVDVNFKRVSTVLALVAASSAANAAFNSYTDQASWASAVGVPALLETFDDGTADGFAVSTLGAGHSFSIASGRMNDRVTRSGATSTTLTFDAAITSFGANWDLSPGGQGQGLQIFVDGALAGTIANTFTGGFYGFVSTQAFSSLTIVAGQQGGSAETYNLDNARFAAAVPEPEGLALLLAGLGVVGFAARRRQG